MELFLLGVDGFDLLGVMVVGFFLGVAILVLVALGLVVCLFWLVVLVVVEVVVVVVVVVVRSIGVWVDLGGRAGGGPMELV